MTQVTEKVSLKNIKKENEKMIMKTFGLEYEKYFAQRRQDED